MRYLLLLYLFTICAGFVGTSVAGGPTTSSLTTTCATVTPDEINHVGKPLVDYGEAVRIFRAAAAADDESLIPALEDAALRWSEDQNRSLAAYYAMHAIWEIANGASDFSFTHMSSEARNANLLRYAILISARSPGPNLRKKLNELEKSESHLLDQRERGVHNAIAMAKLALEENRRWTDMKIRANRIDFLLRHAASTWNPISGLDSDPIDQISPLPFWARKELSVIARRDPQVVAQRVLSADLAPGEYEDVYEWEARDYVIQFLPKEVGEAYHEAKKKHRK